MVAANHIPDAADRLSAFIQGGGYLGLADDDLIAIAQVWGEWIVNEWGEKSHILGALVKRHSVNEIPSKWAAEALKAIERAWQKYNNWLLAQRKRVDDISKRRAVARRDQAVATAISGLIVALKFLPQIKPV